MAIEGPSFLFRCVEIRKKYPFVEDPSVFSNRCPCLIRVVIQEAEQLLRDKLKTKSLRWLYDEAQKAFSPKKRAAMAKWLERIWSQRRRAGPRSVSLTISSLVSRSSAISLPSERRAMSSSIASIQSDLVTKYGLR